MLNATLHGCLVEAFAVCARRQENCASVGKTKERLAIGKSVFVNGNHSRLCAFSLICCEALRDECLDLLLQALILFCHRWFSLLLLIGGRYKLPGAIDSLVQKDKVALLDVDDQV